MYEMSALELLASLGGYLKAIMSEYAFDSVAGMIGGVREAIEELLSEVDEAYDDGYCACMEDIVEENGGLVVVCTKCGEAVDNEDDGEEDAPEDADDAPGEK